MPCPSRTVGGACLRLEVKPIPQRYRPVSVRAISSCELPFDVHPKSKRRIRREFHGRPPSGSGSTITQPEGCLCATGPGCLRCPRLRAGECWQRSESSRCRHLPPRCGTSCLPCCVFDPAIARRDRYAARCAQMRLRRLHPGAVDPPRSGCPGWTRMIARPPCLICAGRGDNPGRICTICRDAA